MHVIARFRPILISRVHVEGLVHLRWHGVRVRPVSDSDSVCFREVKKSDLCSISSFPFLFSYIFFVFSFIFLKLCEIQIPW